jgi:hypothetical protein
MWRISFILGFAFLTLTAMAALFGFGIASTGPLVACQTALVVCLGLAATSFTAGWFVRRLERYNDSTESDNACSHVLRSAVEWPRHESMRSHRRTGELARN